MSDDLPETGDKAIRWFVGFFVLGAVLEGWVAWHHDEIIRALEYWGVGAVLTAIGVFWTRIRTWAGPRFSATAAHVATDFRWWVVAIISILSLLTFSQFAEQQRWSTSWQLSAFIGVFLLLVMGSIIGSALLGKRILHRNHERSVASAEPGAFSIHTCRIEVYEDKLPSELYIDFHITVYNSEYFSIAINSVSGTISIGNMPGTILSSPMILDHPNQSEIPPKSELTFTLRQHMPSTTAATFHHSISNGDTMVCGLRSLIISVSRRDKAGAACRLLIWDEIRLVKAIVAHRGIHIGVRITS